MRHHLNTIFCLTLIILGCEETIVLDLDQSDSLVVIEGLITDENKHHTIRVSESRGFYDSIGTHPVNEAIVSVSNGVQDILFIHNPTDHPDSSGYYVSEIPFAAEIGQQYELVVSLGSDQYQGSDRVLPLAPLDSLSFQIDKEEEESPEEEGFIYEVLFFFKEPQDSKDYYLFKFFRNNEEIYDDYEDVYVSDDELLNENIDGVSAAGFYQLRDTATVRVFSLSRNMFLFYRDLSTSLNNDGGLFSPTPTNPRSNLTNGALGFFQTSVVDEMDIIIR